MASLTAYTIPKQQFGGRNGFSKTNTLAGLIGYIEINQSQDNVTSVLAFDTSSAFNNVHESVLLETMSDIELTKASRCCVNYFLGRRKSTLIINDQVNKLGLYRFRYSPGFVDFTASGIGLYKFSVQ